MSNYKPVTQIASDEKALNKLWEFLTGYPKHDNLVIKTGEFMQVEVAGSAAGKKHFVAIWPDGEIFFEIEGEDYPITHHFELVDFIRSLGYSNVTP